MQLVPSIGSLRSRLRALLLPGILCLAAGVADAQGAGTASGTGGSQTTAWQGPITQHPLVVPATPFQWSVSSGLGVVKVPMPGQFGWFNIAGQNWQARVIPSLSTDPTLEVVFYPPASGHPEKAERITIQFPTNPDAIRGGGAMVLAFHSYGVSEKDIWVNTNLPQLCAQRGWLLVAPYGLVDTHYGNLPSQKSLDEVMKLVDAFFDWDEDRVYAAGFSMGGGAAMSYAMRRQDGKRMPIAGVINHTGTVDLIDTYDSGTLALKQLMANQHHFGVAPGTPDTDFTYERVSPAILAGSAIDPLRASARNLSHLPLYFFVNLDDPQGDLVADNVALGTYLQSEGVNVNTVALHAGATHSWSSLNLDTAFDWIEHYSQPPTPEDTPVFADSTTRFFHTTVRAKPAKRIAHFELDTDLASSTVSVTNSRNLDSLVLHLGDLGFAPRQYVGGMWNSVDGTDDELVLTGYDLPPSQVLLNGTPLTTWSHDPILGELAFTLPGGSGNVIWSVSP